jgi:hypothetical protein
LARERAERLRRDPAQAATTTGGRMTTRKARTVRDGLEAIKRDHGLARYHLIRRCVAGVAELETPALAALSDAFEKGIVPAMLDGNAPAGSEAEALDRIVNALGPERVALFVPLVECLRRMDAPSLRAVSILVQGVATGAASGDAGGLN